MNTTNNNKKKKQKKNQSIKTKSARCFPGEGFGARHGGRPSHAAQVARLGPRVVEG
jgi:hypothetical protein